LRRIAQFRQLDDILQRLGVRAIVYSTYRHGASDSENHPDANAPGERYRVFIPLETPVSMQSFPRFGSGLTFCSAAKLTQPAKTRRAHITFLRTDRRHFRLQGLRRAIAARRRLARQREDFHTPQYTPLRPRRRQPDARDDFNTPPQMRTRRNY
jgi:hypothetical protein